MSKGWYRYTSDGNRDYMIEVQKDLADIARLEPCEGLLPIPSKLTPRYVWLQAKDWQGNRPIRKKVILQRDQVPVLRPGTTVMVGDMEMVVKSYRGECGRPGIW